MELRGRLRQPLETNRLTDLYRDIKRLIALGYPDLDPEVREVIAVDRFIDSLGPRRRGTSAENPRAHAYHAGRSPEGRSQAGGLE